MSNLNNFNICPRCNTPNPMVAKFCFQCGTQLKSPDTPTVCSKCNTVNTGRSSYCKTCGNKLVGASATKICPRCSNTVHANSNICEKCGYAFSSASAAYPRNGAQGAKAASASLTQQAAAQRQRGRAVNVRSGSGKGRAAGFFALILALAAAYFLLMPPFMALQGFGQGFLRVNGTILTGWGYIKNIINNFSGIFAAQTVLDWAILGVFALTLLTVLVEFISGLVQLIKGRQAKKAKGFLLFITIVTLLAAAFVNLALRGESLAAGSSGFIASVFNWFASLKGSRLGNVSVSWTFNLCAAYMFAAFLFSVFFKMSKKEQKVLLVGR